jgi:hypothetical protein
MDFNLFNHYILSLNLLKKDSIIGIGSKCKDGTHILHLDLDDKTEFESVKILRNLQYLYNLGTCLLLKSSDNSYHGIFFDKLEFKVMINIQKDVNLKHGCMSEMKGESTIRLSSKFGSFVEYRRVLINNVIGYKKSLSHYNAIMNHFDIKQRFAKYYRTMFSNLDNSKDVNLFCYNKTVKIW